MSAPRRRAAVLIIVALVIGLGASSATARDSGILGAAALSQTPNIDLRIGVVAPLTGNLSTIGPGQVEGSRVAAQVISRALRSTGLSRSVSVRIAGIEDSQGDTVPAVQAATKLATTSNIDVLVGSCATRETLAIAQSVTVRRKIVQISMCSAAAELSNLKDGGYVWQMIYPNTLLAQAFVQAAQISFGRRVTVNTGSINDAGNGGFRKAFDKAWRATGGRIGQSVAWNLQQPTYDTEAQRMVSGNPRGWVIVTTPEDWKKLGPALVRTGQWSPARTLVIEVFRDPATLKELGDPATRGLRGVSPTNEGSPAKKAFDAIFKRYGKTRPTGFDSLGFDPVVAAFLASLRARSDDPAKIRRNLQAISGPPGIRIKPNQIALAIRTLMAGREINYDGGWGNLDWDRRGDPGSSLFELWRYPGNGAAIPSGRIINVKAKR